MFYDTFWRAGAAGTALALSFLGATQPAMAHGSKPIPDGHGPAGVMVDHMHKAGEFMVGYRYMWNKTSGDILNGTRSVTNAEIMAKACQKQAVPRNCMMRPNDMTMQMHMLDIMYAPTDWMTLMVMPMWMTMGMDMTRLNNPSIHAGHDTDGIGDTIFGALLKISEGPGYNLHTGLMFSAPTGSTTETGPSGAMTHYMMQLGSGTWDFLPSLTYTGRVERWSWGVQASGIIRLEDENDEGYKLGDVFQATAWGAYRLNDWVSTSLRVLYTRQGEVEGSLDHTAMGASPPDLPSNYGGRFVDIGFGVNFVVPEGTLKGHRLSVEWLESVLDDVNGYQQERDGTLWVNWSKAF